MKASIRLALALCLAPLAASQTTWVVDPAGGPGVDFTDLDDALPVAGPLDVIDLRPGTHSANVTRSRGIRIVGEDPETTRVTGWFTISDVPAGEIFCVAGVELGSRAELRDCEGLVLF